MEPVGHEVGNLLVIEIRHEKMRIPFDADIGQMDDFGMAAVTVDGSDEFLCHVEFTAPFIRANLFGWLIGNVIAIIKNDRNLRQFN